MKAEHTEEQFHEYCHRILNKFKQDPQYEEKQELGKMLLRHIDSFSPDELKRYNELQEILNIKSNDN